MENILYTKLHLKNAIVLNKASLFPYKLILLLLFQTCLGQQIFLGMLMSERKLISHADRGRTGTHLGVWMSFCSLAACRQGCTTSNSLISTVKTPLLSTTRAHESFSSCGTEHDTLPSEQSSGCIHLSIQILQYF